VVAVQRRLTNIYLFGSYS